MREGLGLLIHRRGDRASELLLLEEANEIAAESFDVKGVVRIEQATVADAAMSVENLVPLGANHRGRDG